MEMFAIYAVTGSYGALEIWLVWQRNWFLNFINLNLSIHKWLMTIGQHISWLQNLNPLIL